MTISFSGLVSGLDTSSWVEALLSVKQQDITALQTELTAQQTSKTTLTTTRSITSSLRTAIEKLTDAKFGGTFDLFAKTKAKSSNEDIFTASASTGAKIQNYDIAVKQLATYTKATSQESASDIAGDTTSLKNLGISKGDLTVYVNGKKNTINISESDTVGDLKMRLAEAGVNMQINDDGSLTFIPMQEGDNISIGATTDTTNFVSMVGLEKNENGQYVSTNSLYKATTASLLTDAEAGFKQTITAGTFKIGDATFTIDENTTLSSLISKINSTKDAQAYAYWDDSTGKLSITSTKEGASYINIEAGTSNFTDVMGLTKSKWDEEGNLVSTTMLTEAQALGKNAIFSINGTTMTSTSNTVTSDISRIEGVTLTLKRTTTEDDGNVTLDVTQNTDDLTSALKTFVSAYNDFINQIDTVTASGADFHGESSLTSLKNTIRNYANGSNDMNGGAFRLLSQIGISTGAADSNMSDDTNTLSFDEETFLKALEDDPESVKALLTGDNSIFGMMEETLEQSLKAVTGFFDIKTSTIDSNIQKTNEKITKKSESITTYKAQLEKKFQTMEQMIASMQQNYSSFLS